MHPTLKTITTSAANTKDSAMSVQSLSQAADCPERVHHQAALARRKASILSPTIDLSEGMSVVSSEIFGKCDDGDINSLKRKHSLAFSEEYGSSAPTTLARSLQPFSVAHAELVTSHSAENDEYEKEMRMRSPLSQPALELAKPPSTQLAEFLDGIGSRESSEIWKAFPEITSHQRSHIERTVDCLFRDDLATFLEKHSATWNDSGFWNGPARNTAASSKFLPGSNQTGPTAYLLGLRNDSETYDLELRIARVHLFLLFQREIMLDRRRGIPKQIAKNNAVSHLCNSRGLGLAEKTKLHQLFYTEKRIGGYWWWCVSFFGPSFLLRCSTKAGKMINHNRFPLDAMIAYVLHEYPQTVKPHALDAAVVHLLMTGNFPEKLSQQGGATQVHSTHAKPAVIPVWRFFSTEAAEEDAVSCLHRWSTNPENRLLTI